MRLRSGGGLLLCAVLVVVVAPVAHAKSCAHVVVVTLPGVTWSEVAGERLPNLKAALRNGASGSMSVRTIDPRTSDADGFATIGAGARVQGGSVAGGIAPTQVSTVRGDPPSMGPPFGSATAAGVTEIQELARTAGYGARAGALGAALEKAGVSMGAIGNGDPGLPPPAPAGFGEWSLLAAMDPSGVVLNSSVRADLLRGSTGPFGVSSDPSRERAAIDAALALPCSVLIANEGDLNRVDLASLLSGDRASAGGRVALAAADDLVGYIRSKLNRQRDLLLILSPTSPRAERATHLGVAVAEGPGFLAGDTLESASTRRAGFVTLPDVAPTVLSFLGLPQPSVMNGRPWRATDGAGGNRITQAITTDDEAVFVDRLQPDVSTTFVAFQVAVYLIALLLIARHEHRATAASDGFRRWLEVVVLSVVAFPLATYLAGVVDAHQLGVWGMVVLLVALDIALVGGTTLILKAPLDRLLAVTALTVAVLVTDLAFGAHLQLSTVFGYSPIVAGRFAGIGNIGFAVLASSSVLTGALVVHRWRASPGALAFAAALFVVTIIADGSPALGSDVGGVIALVPALLITWILLAGKRPTLRILLMAALAAGAALVLFLVLDLSRPAASQTHLARLFEDFRARGSSALTDTIGRKARANMQVFRSTVWTLSVPPALAVMAWLLLRPRGRWQVLVETYPRLRAGLVGALLVGVLGFAVNDSGIVIPAVVLAFFVPLAVLLHLSLMERRPGSRIERHPG